MPLLQPILPSDSAVAEWEATLTQPTATVKGVVEYTDVMPASATENRVQAEHTERLKGNPSADNQLRARGAFGDLKRKVDEALSEFLRCLREKAT